MILHFAYGSNMSRVHMQRRCPSAKAIGLARLDGWRYLIMSDGYASAAPSPGRTVHGVLWHLQPRDLAALNAYENLDQGVYVRRILPVRMGSQCKAALVYVGRSREPGRPVRGYRELVIASAREWGLPEDYVRALYRC
ncbi:MAG TPA: gamma-glutamylcyclotransferase family protein [Xanthobacteraceae bacterium]|jgi:gamma-glutamylcyclotransferase (GGCT)/AIG2-like uncharacterized protein YtfP|nr:gamma-glutamylcyclotransferase family protein [Xanthobacteraceae bacterium]